MTSSRQKLGLDLLSLVERIVDERVEMQLAARGLAAVYTTTAPPPGISRRSFHAACRGIPAATKDGRTWRCPAAAWRAARAARPKVKSTLTVVPDDDADPSELLEAAGMRRTRGPR